MRDPDRSDEPRRLPLSKRRAFVQRHTRLRDVDGIPGVRLHLADAVEPVWHAVEEALGIDGAPIPFWAFAWAGGQALARHILDDPELVAGRAVLDLATGSGLVAVAAARAGARVVTANDIDPLSLAAAQANAEANGVRIQTVEDDLLEIGYPDADVILAGDVFYSREMGGRVLPFLRKAAGRGALVLVGDPGRAYLPTDGLVLRQTYDVPVVESLESVPERRTSVWQVFTSR